MSNFHKIKNKSILDKCPPETDEVKWDQFIKEMKQAENHEILDHPTQIDIELNAGCNMNCPFCLHGFEDIKDTRMDIEQYKSLIDEAVSMGTKSLKLNYINEPMLRKDLESCIGYAKARGILNIYFVTNGTLLNPRRRISILKSGVTKIFVSIDAITEETYNKQRLNGKYARVLINTSELIRNRNSTKSKFPIIRVSFLENAINIHEKEEFEKFWTNRADIVAFQKMNEVPDHETHLTLTDHNKKEFDEPKGCEFPFKQLVVDANGDILPCCKMSGKALKLGNIDNMTLKEAWKSNKMKTLQELHQSDNWRHHPICGRCMTE